MFATVTADATMTRASNVYVKSLFDDYAHNFEHSLVDELGYNGFERLRRGFDRAFGGREKVPTFKLVIDAGCGTGLVPHPASNDKFKSRNFLSSTKRPIEPSTQPLKSIVTKLVDQ